MYKKLILLVALMSPIIVMAQLANKDSDKDIRTSSQKFSQFLYYLDKGYLEKIESDKLTQEAIKAVLEKLDPHSSYITKEEMIDVNDSFEGNFEGIGIEFNVLKDTIIVVNTIVGGPSEKVGLKPNDRIVKVDGKSVIGLKQMEVPKILRGAKGTKITASIVRRSEKDTLDFIIERDKIPMNSLDAAYYINKETAYVKLNRFMATTTKEFITAMAKMPNAKNLILDFRGNGGGFMDQAISMSDNLLSPGELIVYAEGRSVPRNDAKAGNAGIFRKGKLIVLVDEDSASASEIVAGAVQDWDRGLVIGRPTFGKGLVQRQIPFLDSSAMRVTVARYHTPTGRVIQRPYELGKRDDYYSNIMNRYINGELVNIDSLHKHTPDSLKFKTLKSGRTVFGGGGIMPDIFVPIDTTMYSKYWGELIRKGVLSEFVIDYMDKNRSSLNKKYGTFEEFNSDFIVTDDIAEQLYLLGEKKGVTRNTEEIERSVAVIKKQIKALVAQKLWDTTEYFRVVNSTDNDIIDKALEALANWDTVAVGIR